MDENAHTGCYIFKPAPQDDGDVDPRPQKKRKLNKKAAEPIHDHNAWPRLLGGQESQEAANLRKTLFEAAWNTQQAKLNDVGTSFDERLVSEVLESRHGEPGRSGRLRTCLLLSPAGTQHDSHNLLDRKVQEMRDTGTDVLLRLQPTQCPNLQTALKSIIRTSITGHGEDEKTYTDFLAEHKALLPMNFDLELLQRYAQRHKILRVLISVLDVETFDTAILSELISTLHSWSDRIPFMLCIGISTTAELFESRFSRATIRLLDAYIVETKFSRRGEDPLFILYEKIQHGSDTEVFLGASVVNVLAELAEDQGTTPETLTRAIKYVYMSQFFANPVSILLDYDPTFLGNKALCAAIRNIPSFKSHCENLAKGDKSQRQKARQLLTSNEALDADVKEAISYGRKLMRSSLQAIRTIRHIYHHILNLDKYTPWESEVQLLSSLPDLTNSAIFKAIVDAMTFRDTPPLAQMLDSSSSALDDLKHFSASTADSAPTEQQDMLPLLRSYIAQRTSAPSSSSPSSPTPHPQPSPFSTFLTESQTVTTKSPLSQTIHPRPRFCLERALTRPADYLGCACCTTGTPSSTEDDEDGTSKKRGLPPTSLLLNMLNEAGVLVNVRDLWDAFRQTQAQHLSLSQNRNDKERDEEAAEDDDEDAQSDDDAIDERQILALFYHSLAELRYLGLIKQSKRKPGVELVQKTAWMGL